MDIRESWLVKIHKNLLEQKEKIHKKDFRFFQIDILLELARRSQIFSNSCDVCRANKQVIEDLSVSVADKINTIKGRNEVTKQIDKIVQHLKKKHKIYIKGYFLAVGSFWGILIGTVLGLVVGELFDFQLISSVSAGFVIGLFVGRFLGNIFEKKAGSENRLIKPDIISPLEEMIKKAREQD